MKYLKYPLEGFKFLQEKTNTAVAVTVPMTVVDIIGGGIIGGTDGVILSLFNNAKFLALTAIEKSARPTITEKLWGPKISTKLDALSKVAEKLEGDNAIKFDSAAVILAADLAVDGIAYGLGRLIQKNTAEEGQPAVYQAYALVPTGEGVMFAAASDIIKLALITAIDEGYITFPELDHTSSLEVKEIAVPTQEI
jgi:hypothetical protein